jgi:hypothetical protein
MNASGTVTLTRCTMPFHGRTTSRRNQAESPRLVTAAPTAAGASRRSPSSAARRGASANTPPVPRTATATAAVSCASFSRDWTNASSPGGGTFERRSRRKAPATIVAKPAAPIIAGPHPGRGLSRRSSAEAKTTVQLPSATNPAVITCGSFASFAARPLMCSCRTW